jgi:hypothetical protein
VLYTKQNKLRGVLLGSYKYELIIATGINHGMLIIGKLYRNSPNFLSLGDKSWPTRIMPNTSLHSISLQVLNPDISLTVRIILTHELRNTHHKPFHHNQSEIRCAISQLLICPNSSNPKDPPPDSQSFVNDNATSSLPLLQGNTALLHAISKRRIIPEYIR